MDNCLIIDVSTNYAICSKPITEFRKVDISTSIVLLFVEKKSIQVCSKHRAMYVFIRAMSAFINAFIDSA